MYLFPSVLTKYTLYIFSNLSFKSLCLCVHIFKIFVESKHSILEFSFCHAVVLNNNAYIAACIKGIILILYAVLIVLVVLAVFNRRSLTKTYNVPVYSVRETLCQPVDLLLPVRFSLDLLIVALFGSGSKGCFVFSDKL